MKNEIDWAGEAADWLMANGMDASMASALARLLEETAKIYAEIQDTDRQP